jgi:dTDP-glucose 4,6-dehydratase
VLARGKVGETYHVGSGVEASIMEVADRILDALGKPESLKTIVPDRPGHDRRYVLDSSKLRRELGWAPSVEWDQGLADTVAWYASNRDWWEPLIARAPVAEGAWGGTGAG